MQNVQKDHVEVAEEPLKYLRTDWCFGAIPTNMAAVIDVTAHPAKQPLCAMTTLFP